MEYRKLPHGNEKISVLGMGTSVVGEASEKNVVETITYALDNGINYIDLAKLGDVLAKEHYLTLEKMLPSVFSAATATKDVRSLLTR